MRTPSYFVQVDFIEGVNPEQQKPGPTAHYHCVVYSNGVEIGFFRTSKESEIKSAAVRLIHSLGAVSTRYRDVVVRSLEVSMSQELSDALEERDRLRRQTDRVRELAHPDANGHPFTCDSVPVAKLRAALDTERQETTE